MPFQVGHVYKVFCTYTQPPKEKFVICVGTDKKLILFFINSKPRVYASANSQILVSPDDLNCLRYDSYINTADNATCIVPITCQIRSHLGEIPKMIKGKIRESMPGNRTLPKRFIQWILEEL